MHLPLGTFKFQLASPKEPEGTQVTVSRSKLKVEHEIELLAHARESDLSGPILTSQLAGLDNKSLYFSQLSVPYLPWFLLSWYSYRSWLFIIFGHFHPLFLYSPGTPMVQVLEVE
jgi:hypothetical protein